MSVSDSIYQALFKEIPALEKMDDYAYGPVCQRGFQKELQGINKEYSARYKDFRKDQADFIEKVSHIWNKASFLKNDQAPEKNVLGEPLSEKDFDRAKARWKTLQDWKFDLLMETERSLSWGEEILCMLSSLGSFIYKNTLGRLFGSESSVTRKERKVVERALKKQKIHQERLRRLDENFSFEQARFLYYQMGALYFLYLNSNAMIKRDSKGEVLGLGAGVEKDYIREWFKPLCSYFENGEGEERFKDTSASDFKMGLEEFSNPLKNTDEPSELSLRDRLKEIALLMKKSFSFIELPASSYHCFDQWYQHSFLEAQVLTQKDAFYLKELLFAYRGRGESFLNEPKDFKEEGYKKEREGAIDSALCSQSDSDSISKDF